MPQTLISLLALALAPALAVLPAWLDARHLVETFGLIGVGAIVFAESGLLIGLFLPGDSLLFTAGIFAATGRISFPLLLPVAFVAAVAGDSAGYAFGTRAGRSLYRRPDSRLFKHEHLERARAFYERRGGSTIVLARFIPIVRTFAPIVAGAARMEYRRFIAFNVVGGLLWSLGVPSAGYLLGRVVPDIDRYLLPVVGIIVLISVAPMLREMLRARRRRTRAPAREPDPT